MKFILLQLLVVIIAGCTNSSPIGKEISYSQDTTNSNEEEEMEGNLDSLTEQIPNTIVDKLEASLKDKLKAGSEELPFEKDNSYKLGERSLYKASFGWYAFLLKGNLLPSQAEFHIYGIYKNADNLKYDFYSQPVEIVTEFKKYKATNNSVKIYGFQWDLSGADDGSKPPKDQELLIANP